MTYILSIENLHRIGYNPDYGVFSERSACFFFLQFPVTYWLGYSFQARIALNVCMHGGRKTNYCPWDMEGTARKPDVFLQFY
jgi:hypothetical protein